MAVHAHPDDESSKGAATYAHYRSQGAEVCIVSCTGGESGSILNDQLERHAWAERDIAGLRRLEMAEAQRILDVDHVWLGYVDSGMAREDGTLPPLSFATIPVDIAVQPLVKSIRERKPHVIICYDENGGYPHPDHIMSHLIAVRAWDAAADPAFHPELGEPWEVSKLYYERIWNIPRFQAMAKHLQETEPGSELRDRIVESLERFRDRPRSVTTSITVADQFEVGARALRAHASQVPPDSPFFFWPVDLVRAAWPTEDFELVKSRIGSIPGPEDDIERDLFAGIEDAR